MNHKNLLLILFFCLFLTPFMANGATVGGYFQIDVNVLRDGNNNPISLNNIALYRDEQSTFPEFFTGETIYEGYSYTSLYQELTVGQSYTLGFGNMAAKHLRANSSLAGIMVLLSTSTNCTTSCADKGFSCTDQAQQQLAANITVAEQGRLLGSYTRTCLATGAPLRSNGYNVGGSWEYVLATAPSDLSTVTCTSAGYCTTQQTSCQGRLCACGGWKIVVTI